MRKYQRRAVAKLAAAYNSNDPLRWHDCRVLTKGALTAYLQASPREKMLLHRRMLRGLASFGIAMKTAAEGMQAFAAAISGRKNVQTIAPRATGKTLMRNLIVGEMKIPALAKGEIVTGDTSC